VNSAEIAIILLVSSFIRPSIRYQLQ